MKKSPKHQGNYRASRLLKWLALHPLNTSSSKPAVAGIVDQSLLAIATQAPSKTVLLGLAAWFSALADASTQPSPPSPAETSPKSPQLVPQYMPLVQEHVEAAADPQALEPAERLLRLGLDGRWRGDARSLLLSSAHLALPPVRSIAGARPT